MKLISLIVPVYNEEQMLPIFFEKINELFINNDKYNYEVLIVNDGSKDNTLNIIKEEAKKNKKISYISFSKNFGQEAAVEAGLKNAQGDAVIPIDCDFQDPPEVIFEMLKKYEEGFEVVNAKRVSRKEDTLAKKTSAGLFYKITNKIAKKKVIEENVCYFRLLSRRVLDHLNSLPESARIIRSEVPYIGFKTCEVTFNRVARKAGKTKYNYSKLFDVAANTFTASTPNLLKWPFKIGVILLMISFCAAVPLLVLYFLQPENTFYYFPFIVLSFILLASSLIIITFSIHSLYLKNIYTNVIHRPNYIIDEQYSAYKDSLAID